MRYLYEIDDGAKYWVVAETKAAAVRQLLYEVDDFGDTIEFSMTIRQLRYDEAKKRTLQVDGEDESCSMWLAYVLVRDLGCTVLGCSEWP